MMCVVGCFRSLRLAPFVCSSVFACFRVLVVVVLHGRLSSTVISSLLTLSLSLCLPSSPSARRAASSCLTTVNAIVIGLVQTLCLHIGSNTRSNRAFKAQLFGSLAKSDSVHGEGS